MGKFVLGLGHPFSERTTRGREKLFKLWEMPSLIDEFQSKPKSTNGLQTQETKIQTKQTGDKRQFSSLTAAILKTNKIVSLKDLP